MRRIKTNRRINHFKRLILSITFILSTFLPIHLSADIFPVEYFTFKSKTPGKTLVVITLNIRYHQLQYLKYKTNYIAEFDIRLTINKANGKQVSQKMQEHKIVLDSFHKTLDPKPENIIRFSIDLEPGQYQAMVHVTDKTVQTEFKNKVALHVPDYSGGKFAMSSLEFAKMEDNIVNPLHPDLSGVYGFSNPGIGLYFEVYNVPAEADLQTEMAVINSAGKTIKIFSRKLSVSQVNRSFRIPIYTNSLPSDRYVLRVTQRDEKSGREAIAEKSFRVIQSPIDLRYKSFEIIIDELKYVASSVEIEQLSSVNEAGRQMAIYRFWKSKDPTPETVNNELMNEYYRRIDEANYLFSSKNEAGWNTDFGMIYVLFGKPDRIIKQKKRNRFEQKHIWHYQRLSLTFTFSNFYNYNNFTLLDKQYVYANYLP